MEESTGTIRIGHAMSSNFAIRPCPSIDVLPGDYFKRFFNLIKVITACSFDEAHFLQFLRKVYCLHDLILCVSESSQAFLDGLAEESYVRNG